jgi:hypothetical protein
MFGHVTNRAGYFRRSTNCYCIDEGPKAVLIMGEVQLDGTWKHLFSVLGSHLGGHAIVTHIGENSTGTWTYTKDRREFACRHINDARNQLNILLHHDPSVTEPDGHVEGFSIPGKQR